MRGLGCAVIPGSPVIKEACGSAIAVGVPIEAPEAVPGTTDAPPPAAAPVVTTLWASAQDGKELNRIERDRNEESALVIGIL